MSGETPWWQGACADCGKSMKLSSRSGPNPRCRECRHARTNCPCADCGKSMPVRTRSAAEPTCRSCRRRRRERICENCGETFLLQSFTRPRRYCSPDCAALAHRTGGPIIGHRKAYIQRIYYMNCAECSKLIVVTNRKPAVQFCSEPCRVGYPLRLEAKKAAGHPPRARARLAERTCQNPECGKPFQPVNGRQIACSTPCYRRTPDSRERARLRAADDRAVDPDRVRAHSREYFDRVRNLILSHYGRRCACCGSTEDLSLDHMNGDGHERRAALSGNMRHGSGWRTYLFVIREGYPDDYQILCRSCNRSKGRAAHCKLPHRGRECGTGWPTFTPAITGSLMTSSRGRP